MFDWIIVDIVVGWSYLGVLLPDPGNDKYLWAKIYIHSTPCKSTPGKAAMFAVTSCGLKTNLSFMSDRLSGWQWVALGGLVAGNGLVARNGKAVMICDSSGLLLSYAAATSLISITKQPNFVPHLCLPGNLDVKCDQKKMIRELL